MAKEKITLTLKSAHIRGFKSIEDLKIDFDEGLNILIGKNASGKSNFLDGLYQALRVINGRESSYKYAKIEFYTSTKEVFSLQSEKEINVQDSEKNDFSDKVLMRQKLFIDDVLILDSKETNQRAFEYKKQKFNRPINIRQFLYRIGVQSTFPAYLKFHLPINLDCINIPGTIRIDVNEDYNSWSNLNSLFFVEYMLLDLEIHFDSYYAEKKKGILGITKSAILKQLSIDQKIKSQLKKYSPIQDVRFNENINIYKEEKAVIIENLKIDFKVNNHWIPWSQLSDGTKRLFYIISEITNREQGIILLEEPELGIHPHQFNQLMEFLKEKSEDLQIIISTHSPQTLNHLKENELSRILVTYYDSKKGTQLRHLTNSQKKVAKQYMKEVGFLSDYWMLSDLE